MTRKTPWGAEGGSAHKSLALLIGTTCGFVVAPGMSLAGPAGGVVTAGQGTISTPSTTSTVIDQSSNRVSIDWQSFDVGAHESVSFHQPTSNSVALNRILDQKPSEVLGRIDANGRVVLFNANGIVFGVGSQVNVGSLLATSLNIVSFDESTGHLRLSAAGSPGSIVNNGTISAAPGGSVSLVGGMVANNGHIVADLGSVNLAAGRSATLDFYGGGLLRFEADSQLVENASGASAGVSNSGEIAASGGQVLMTTSAVKNVFDRAVNNDGLVSAARIDNSGGVIRLVGAGGTVINTGVLDASGVGGGSTGGSVQLLGENVGLLGNAVVDVSGDAGGGIALVGGDYQGANPDVLNSSQTVVGPDARIDANARVAGDGGRVILWSDDATRFYGDISARGGAESGNGGFAEVSSHGVLGFDGGVNLGSTNGAAGHLLLDPGNITITATLPHTPPNLTFDDSGDTNVNVDPDAIETVLGTTNVEMQARGDILVNAEIDASTTGALGNSLTMRARDDIEVNANISTNHGAIALHAHDQTGDTTADPPFNPEGTGDVRFLNSGITLNAGTTGTPGSITIDSEGSVALGTLRGGAITVTSETGSVTQLASPSPPPPVAALVGTALTVNSATGIDLGSVGTVSITGPLSVTATQTNADVSLVNTGTLSHTNAAVGGDLTISTTGNMTVDMVTANNGTVTLSSGAAILDDGNSTAITADAINLTAATAIGAVTPADLVSGGAGTPISVNTAGALTATVTSATAGAQINLQLDQIPTVGAGDIALGNNAAGTILLQTAGNFDLASFADGAISLGTNNTAQVGLRSGDVLTLPANTTRIFDTAPGTFAVDGATRVEDDDAGAAALDLAFNVGRLIFRSGAAATLNTTVDQLTARLTNQNLTVNETDDIVLDTVDLGSGTLNLDVNGAITDGAASPAVIAGQLVITDAASVVLDTNVNALNASGVDGQLTINEASGPLAVANAASTGGAVNISTATGNLTVTNASGTAVTLNGGAALTVTGTVGAGTGLTTLTAANAMTLTGSTVNTGSATLTSNGAMQLGTINANATTGTLALQAGAANAISDGAGVSVTANQLNISNSASADLGTNVNNLNAAVGAGGLTITEASGPLAVANAASTGGAVNIATTAGNLNVANASGNAVTLNSGGALTVTGTVGAGTGLTTLTAANAMTLTGSTVNTGSATLTSNGAMQLGTINANATTGTLALQAGAANAISDGAGVSVTANQLNISNSASADLGTNVNNLNAAVGAGGLTITEASGPLAVANAASTGGAVNIATTAGNLNVANASGNAVTLNSGGALTVTGTVGAGTGLTTLTAANAMTLTGSTVNTGSATLTSNGAMQLGAINANATTGTVTLQAGTTGAISDGAGVSVTANQLTISNSQAADLNTDVNSLTAAVGNGGLIISEGTGPLTVTNAAGTGGAVNISTTAGNLIVTSASGTNVTLNAGTAGTSGDAIASGNLTASSVLTNANGAANLTADGAITLGTVTATNGTVTLVARDGAITDATPSTVPSVVASTLAITDADSVNLDTNVTTLNATGVTGALTVVDRVSDLAVTNAVSTGAVNVATSNGNLTVTNATGNGVTLVAGGAGNLTAGAVNAGAGAATLTAAGGSILDDDLATTISGGSVALSALNGIGTVTNFVTGAGSSVDVNTSGTLSAAVTTPTTDANTAINLNITGTPVIAVGGIALGSGTGRNGSVLLQSPNALNLQGVTPGAINIGATNNVNVGYVSGALLTLPSGVGPTDTAPNSLLVSGADIVQTGSPARTIDLTANTLIFNATAPAGPFQLNTNVNTLHANVTNGVALDVDEGTGDITLGNITAQALTVRADAVGGAILDDGDDTTVLTAQSVGLGSIGAIGSTTAQGAIDVNTADLTAISGTGDVAINSVSVGSTRVALTAGNAAAVANNGNISLVAAGEVRVAQLVAAQDTVTVSSNGAATNRQIINETTIPVVTASQLVIGGASAVDLGVDIDTLNATGVTGNINLTETGGNLLVTNATAGGAVNVSTVAGALTVNNVTGTNSTLTASTDITLGSVNANPTTGTVSLLAGGAITDAAGATPSVVANQLTITGASSANLDTDVNILNATGFGGALTVREQTGDLAVVNATSTVGDINLTSVAGALTGVNSSGANVTLTSSTGIDLQTVNSGIGTVTLATNGAITDAAGSTPSVVANQLTITSAGSADLDTNVNTLNASGVTGALSIREQTGALAVANASAAGAVNLSTVAGALNVTAATGNGVTLNAGGAGSALTLGTVNAGANTASLAAGGAISDAAGATPSVVANQLTITGAGSADLDTNVNTLNASGVTGALSIREQTGALAVANASATGAVNVSTVAGALNVTSATGGGVTLNAGGAGSALTLGSVNAGANTATLAAGGAISDAAGATPSVVANQLTITGAGSADLDTNVNTLNASGVTGALSIREQTGALAVANASAAGAVNVSTVAGALTDVNATGSNVTLNAGGAGSALTLVAVNANPTTGTASLAAGGAISDSAGATPSVVANQLTITGAGSADLDTNVNNLDATGVTGALSIREQTGALAVANASAAGAVNLTTVAGALNVTAATGNGVTLNAGGAGSALALGTVNAGANTASLAAGGAISDAAGATPSVVANQLTITGAGSADLDTNVNTLNASGVTGALSIREQTGALAVANASATGAVNVSTVAGALNVTSATGGGVTLNAGGAGSALTLGTVNAGANTATLAAGGAISDAAGATPSVVANQLTITGAGSADLDTNVNTLNASGVTGALSIREQTGALAVANASAAGAVNVSTVAGDLNVTEAASAGGALTLTAGGTGALTVASNTASGTSATLTSGGAMTLGTLNAGAGAALLTSGGAMTLGTVNAGSATLNSGAGLTLGTVNANATTGTVSLDAIGAIADAAGAAPSVVANQLTITRAASADLDTNVNSLTASGITGALSIREQSGALTVTNATATGAVNVSAVAGALNVTNATGGGVTLNAGGAGNALTLGTVNAGSNAASLTAGGAILDSTTGATSLTAASATLNAGSVGTAANTFDISVNSLTATTTNEGLFVRDANDIALTSLTGASDQSLVVGAQGDITVTHIGFNGSNGRVLLAAGGDILANGSGTHITADDVELRAGGIAADGGQIGTSGSILRLEVPPTTGSGSSTVPSVLLLQNQSAGGPNAAAQPNQIATSGNSQISVATYDPGEIDPSEFLTTTFSTRTPQGDGVEVLNAGFGTINNGQITFSTPFIQSSLASSTASNAQGEGTLYIDWASFDPNVSLFGTVNPPICLPSDQAEEDAEPADATQPVAAAPASGGGCATSSARYNGPLRLPEVTLVITPNGIEWVRKPSGPVTVFPLIGQLR